MPGPKRARRERTDEWAQIKQWTLWPEQELYEAIRPLVLFHETPGEREKEIDVPRGTLARKAAEFEQLCLYLLVSKGWFRADWQVAVFDLVRKKSKIEEVFGLSCML